MILKFPENVKYFDGSQPPLNQPPPFDDVSALSGNDGHRYLYVDSRTGTAGLVGGFQLSPHNIDDVTHSALMRTVAPAYQCAQTRSARLAVNQPANGPGDPCPALNMVMYNDQPPLGSAPQEYAHAKGVYVEQQGAPPTGFWLVHSVPRFLDPIKAASNSNGSPFPDRPSYSNGFQQGQSFACISLTTQKDHDAVKQALLRNRVYVSLGVVSASVTDACA